MISYEIKERESGRFIEDFGSLQEAQNAITSLEQCDKEDGNYTPDFYKIEEIEKITLEFDKSKISKEIQKAVKALKKLKNLIELLK